MTKALRLMASTREIMTRRILLDVTELLALGLNTGVQRVVRELYAGLLTRSDVTVIPVLAIDGRLSGVAPDALARIIRAPKPTSARTPPRGRLRQLAEAVLMQVPSLFAAAQQRYFIRRLPAMLDRFRQPGHLDLKPNEILVAADTFWTGSEIIQAAGWARRRGATVVTLVYDMIPVSHPALAGAGLSRSFPRLLLKLLKASHGVLTISNSSASEIRRFVSENDLTLPIAVFYLGSNAGAAVATRVADGAWPTGLWAPGISTAVAVGTIEPRKGHDTILAAFELRWQHGAQDRLLLIGKYGTGKGSVSLHASLAAHPELNRRLFVVGNVDDAMLADAYARATVGIMASVVEGFGLPLVEALVAGLPMIASDIAVFKELAGTHARYFRVGDAYDLARVLAETAEAPREAAKVSWPDWQAATTQFVDQLLAFEV